MQREDFKKIAAALMAYYPQRNLIPDKLTFDLWYEDLKDLEYEVCAMALRSYRATHPSNYIPGIFEIREAAAEIVKGPQITWTDAWNHVMDLISKYGYPRSDEAIKEMSPEERSAIQACGGFVELCKSDNLSADRANFRMSFENSMAKKKDTLPPELLKAVEGKRENGKLLCGTSEVHLLQT